jgi:anti-anti-sigma factor
LADPVRGPARTTSHPAYDDGVLRITSIGSPANLAIAGDIDGYTYAALLDTLRRLTDGLHEIHINLADVDYCDLAGLRAMILLAGGSGNHDGGGTRLVLHEVPGQVKTILQILGWDTTPGLAIEEPGQRSASAGSSAPREVVEPAGHPNPTPANGQPPRAMFMASTACYG